LAEKIKHKDNIQTIKKKLKKSRDFLNNLYTKNQERIVSQIVR